ncbi:MAG: response regulator [Paraburkholderia sp.]|jgi:CheY-like chemotaxis protein|uniref:response regulator n=1 Tax=Burkholderiaceae TaxID=119060 RepID=UPI0010F6F9FD|nr:response regulator [Burkholderia sp. 4M9327F10]
MQTILIVDDDPSILAAWKRILKLEGYRVETANDGRAGLSLAHNLEPDLIITDRSMPIMDGIEFCCCLKSVPTLAKIPVILASADYRATGGPPYWDELWQKPVSTDLMLASIRRLTEVSRKS